MPTMTDRGGHQRHQESLKNDEILKHGLSELVSKIEILLRNSHNGGGKNQCQYIKKLPSNVILD